MVPLLSQVSESSRGESQAAIPSFLLPTEFQMMQDSYLNPNLVESQMVKLSQIRHLSIHPRGQVGTCQMVARSPEP